MRGRSWVYKRIDRTGSNELMLRDIVNEMEWNEREAEIIVSIGGCGWGELRRMVVAMYEEQFSKRLTELRTQKGVSARDMSLSIGQNPGYIRAIESGTAFPTMANFFYICEYFNITPQEFFNFGEETSNGMNALVDQLKQFDAEQINALTAFIKTIVKK